jgi:hypothetical protein
LQEIAKLAFASKCLLEQRAGEERANLTWNIWRISALAVMVIGTQTIRTHAAELIDATVHHLGTVGKPEWQEFIDKRPEGQRLDYVFRTNLTENTLFIRQDDVKEE